MICPYCQQMIPAEALICPECGRAVAEPDLETIRRLGRRQIWRRILFIIAGILAVSGICFGALMIMVQLDSRENLLGFILLMALCALPMLLLAAIFFVAGWLIGRGHP